MSQGSREFFLKRFPCLLDVFCILIVLFIVGKKSINHHVYVLIIQHIDTLPKYQIWSKKLSMYVGPHDVYPTIDVHFSILTGECKNKKLVDNIFSSVFVCYQCVEL